MAEMVRIPSAPEANSDRGMISERAVAFLDILGFKKGIETTDLAQFAGRYTHALEQTEGLNGYPIDTAGLPVLFPQHPNGKPFCIRNIFSDSIILISENNSPESCLKLLIYTWRLIQTLISTDMPVRGAITYGDLHVDLGNRIILGLPLTKAYELEKQQDWIGAIIDKSLEDAVPELRDLMSHSSGIFNNLFLEYDVPFKDGTKSRFRTINWRFNMIVECGTRSLFSQSQDVEIRRKVENTPAYASTVVKSKKIYTPDASQVPIELRPFWVGSVEPPFIHGDDL